jgi:cephalosporin hydroxylase
MDPIRQFQDDVRREIEGMKRDRAFRDRSLDWLAASLGHRYSYHFTWMGRPIIQYPQDVLAMQEIIWRVRPDLIVETGIAHGGSLVFHASMLELLGAGEIVGIDVDIRAHNRAELDAHPMRRRMTLIEGSSVAPEVVREVAARAGAAERVLVVLDSNHTHEHVARELEAYAGLVTPGSYCVVFDTVIEDLPGETYPDRSWGPGNSPKTAVREFLERDDRFRVDEEIEAKLGITVAPSGYLVRVR